MAARHSIGAPYLFHLPNRAREKARDNVVARIILGLLVSNYRREGLSLALKAGLVSTPRSISPTQVRSELIYICVFTK